MGTMLRMVRPDEMRAIEAYELETMEVAYAQALSMLAYARSPKSAPVRQQVEWVLSSVRGELERRALAA